MQLKLYKHPEDNHIPRHVTIINETKNQQKFKMWKNIYEKQCS